MNNHSASFFLSFLPFHEYNFIFNKEMVGKGSHTRKRVSPHLEYPCVACDYNCDNPSQILNHYQKKHNFDFESNAVQAPNDLSPQFGCPLCVFCCERSIELLINHYEEDHDLYVMIKGDDITKLSPDEIQKHKRKQQESTTKEKDTDDDLQSEDTSYPEPSQPIEKEQQAKDAKNEHLDHHIKSHEILQKLNEITDMLVNVFKSPSSSTKG
ncbi:uncharacterized protein BX663DRAFT_503010 [Cokeromyces recurvatus]|uniref:uncharacterized protein n=1 Tax=Cokeromyces recurvatus TaxID=90255 RepID=UPI002220CFF1|nr:uncharacterized protein BX663DRAFT_503010 [Cokeromyces recurvatus]KAI7904625.1 hypothetical protein BX663DRAFT_503010 [Cokeromyces recurvatus]